MNLDDALSQIADIRQQVARAQSFRGYRSVTTAFTALVAVATAGVQAWVMPADRFRVDWYLYLWLVAAVVSMAVVGAEMFQRVRRSDSDMQRDLTLCAVEQFLPSLMAGLLLTVVLVQFTNGTVWLLPGMWMILFSMGIFASRRVLPRFSGVVAAFYLLAGLFVLALRKEQGLSPWTMGGVFGAGQLMAAGLLWYVERSNEV